MTTEEPIVEDLEKMAVNDLSLVTLGGSAQLRHPGTPQLRAYIQIPCSFNSWPISSFSSPQARCADITLLSSTFSDYNTGDCQLGFNLGSIV